MTTQKDNQGDKLGLQNSSAQESALAWLPKPEAPSNDNERALLWVVRGFIAHHIYWMLPTLLLAAFSLTLLSLR